MRFLTYAMVGAVGTLVQYTFLVVAVRMHWASAVVASVFGALAGAVVNYLLNARFTFRSKSHASALPKFAMTALLGIALNGVLMKMLIDQFAVNYFVAQMIATVIVLGITYCINLMWSFRSASAGADL